MVEVCDIGKITILQRALSPITGCDCLLDAVVDVEDDFSCETRVCQVKGGIDMLMERNVVDPGAELGGNQGRRAEIEL